MLNYAFTMGGLGVMTYFCPDQYILYKESNQLILFGYMTGIGLSLLLWPSTQIKALMVYLALEGFLLSQCFNISLKIQIVEAGSLQEWNPIHQCSRVLIHTAKILLTIPFWIGGIYFGLGMKEIADSKEYKEWKKQSSKKR